MGLQLNTPSSVLSKLASPQHTFSNDATMQRKFGVTFVMEKVVFWNARSPVIKSIFLLQPYHLWPGCLGITNWDWLRRPSPNKVSVITGRDSHVEVLFIGSYCMPVAAGTQDWCRGDKAAMGGSCCRLGMFAGKTGPTQSEEEGESKSGCCGEQTTWKGGASKTDLTESI